MIDSLAKPLQQTERVYVRSGRRILLYFGGCDYFRLSSNPQILRVIRETLRREGLSTAASRKTTGNHRLYGYLENETARFFGAASALCVSSGYLANIVAGRGLRGRIDTALADERIHGSLEDGLGMAGVRVLRFKHRDSADLQRKMGKAVARRWLVVTDGVFAYDGGVPPLAEYRRIAGESSILWVDEAHAAGVIGPQGRGAVWHCGVAGRNVIQTVTFSKAFGAYGGAVVGDQQFVRGLIRESSVVAGNTPLPLPLAAAALKGLKLVRSEPGWQQRLRANVELFWSLIGGAPSDTASPIIPVVADHPVKMRRALLSAGIYPPFIRYPGGPEAGYFRFAISSEHTKRQIALLAAALRGCRAGWRADV